MAIGERIRYFRNLRGMTLKILGVKVGINDKNADVRMAQYESGSRTPKGNLVNALAKALSVSPCALHVPDIDSSIGIIHTFFALEDLCGLKPDRIDDKRCITLSSTESVPYATLLEIFDAWLKERRQLQAGEITNEEYDTWRYTYPEWKIEP